MTPDKDLVGTIIGSRVIRGKPDVLSDVGGAFQGKDRSGEPPKDGVSRLIHMLRSRVTRRNKATAAGYTTSHKSGLSSRLEISMLFPRHTRPNSARMIAVRMVRSNTMDTYILGKDESRVDCMEQVDQTGLLTLGTTKPKIAHPHQFLHWMNDSSLAYLLKQTKLWNAYVPWNPESRLDRYMSWV